MELVFESQEYQMWALCYRGKTFWSFPLVEAAARPDPTNFAYLSSEGALCLYTSAVSGSPDSATATQ